MCTYKLLYKFKSIDCYNTTCYEKLFWNTPERKWRLNFPIIRRAWRYQVVAKEISRKLLTELSLSWSRDSSSISRTGFGFGFWRLDANNYRQYAQALYSAYNAKRISMNGWRWNPVGMGRGGRGWRRGGRDEVTRRDRGGNVRGGAAGCWGQDETIIEMEMPLTQSESN